MSNLIPAGMDRNTLAMLLDDVMHHVLDGDSFEGNISYNMPDPEVAVREGWPSANAEFWVTAVYRIGNREGQGGMRMIGTVPTTPRPPRTDREDPRGEPTEGWFDEQW
jgi:hypothetical protein